MGQNPTHFIKFFKTLASIIKNHESDIKLLAVATTSTLFVSLVAAATAEVKVLFIFAGCATLLVEYLILLYEAVSQLSTCSLNKLLPLVLANLVYRLP